MANPRKRKRLPGSGKKQIETRMPKKQYKRVKKMLYILSGILLVVFGGGAALVGQGGPPPPTPTPVPAVTEPAPTAPAASQTFTATPTLVAPAPTATP